jgi:hypothetical protein
MYSLLIQEKITNRFLLFLKKTMLRKNSPLLGMITHLCNPRTREAEAVGSPVQGQPGLHSEILFQKSPKITTTKKAFPKVDYDSIIIYVHFLSGGRPQMYVNQDILH